MSNLPATTNNNSLSQKSENIIQRKISQILLSAYGTRKLLNKVKGGLNNFFSKTDTNLKMLAGELQPHESHVATITFMEDGEMVTRCVVIDRSGNISRDLVIGFFNDGTPKDMFYMNEFLDNLSNDDVINIITDGVQETKLDLKQLNK